MRGKSRDTAASSVVSLGRAGTLSGGTCGQRAHQSQVDGRVEGWPRGQTWSVCGGQSCSNVGSALRSFSEESGLFALVSEAAVVQLVVSIMCWHSPFSVELGADACVTRTHARTHTHTHTHTDTHTHTHTH